MLKMEYFFFSLKQKGERGEKEGKELEGEGWISVGVIVNYVCV